jgi:hypothetical protein
MQWNIHSDESPEEEILSTLLELREAVATTLGRDQYVYRLLEDAISTGYGPAREAALREFRQQPAEVRQRVQDALRGAQ